MKTMAFLLVLLMANASFAQPSQAEPLLGVMSSPQGISIQVHSGGCTRQDSFAPQLNRDNEITKVTFYRVVPDTCMAQLYYGTVLTYSFEELGLRPYEKFEVTNGLSYSKVF